MKKNSRSFLHVFSSAALLGLAAAAQAGSVQVSVTDAEGKPASDVVVLVSSTAKPPAMPAAAPVVIAQQDLRFVPFLTVVPVGATLRFVNRDAFDHHVRSTATGPLGNVPSTINFEFRLDAAAAKAGGATAASDALKPAATAASPKRGDASNADVRLNVAGPVGLGCHLHSSMRGQVYASPTPWFGKTDANGAVTIDGVPDGAAEIALWHGDQLQVQPGQRVQVSDTPVKASAQLNFTPRRRRGG